LNGKSLLSVSLPENKYKSSIRKLKFNEKQLSVTESWNETVKENAIEIDSDDLFEEQDKSIFIN